MRSTIRTRQACLRFKSKYMKISDDMKITKYLSFVSASALLLTAVACGNDEYQPGQSDSADSYNIYFTAGQSGDYAYQIGTGSIKLEFTAQRDDATREVVVPLNVTGDNTTSMEVSPLAFAAGQSSATFTVTIDPAMLEIQQEYEYVISIPAPEYSLIYGMNETSVTFTVILEDYQRYATGSYTCDMFTRPVSATLEYSPSLNTYRIAKLWDNSADPIVFEWAGEESEVVTFASGASFATGVDFGEGLIYATPEDGSNFNTETRTFTFDLYYNIPGLGGYLFDPDTFQLN